MRIRSTSKLITFEDVISKINRQTNDIYEMPALLDFIEKGELEARVLVPLKLIEDEGLVLLPSDRSCIPFGKGPDYFDQAQIKGQARYEEAREWSNKLLPVCNVDKQGYCFSLAPSCFGRPSEITGCYTLRTFIGENLMQLPEGFDCEKGNLPKTIGYELNKVYVDAEHAVTYDSVKYQEKVDESKKIFIFEPTTFRLSIGMPEHIRSTEFRNTYYLQAFFLNADVNNFLQRMERKGRLCNTNYHDDPSLRVRTRRNNFIEYWFQREGIDITQPTGQGARNLWASWGTLYSKKYPQNKQLFNQDIKDGTIWDFLRDFTRVKLQAGNKPS